MDQVQQAVQDFSWWQLGLAVVAFTAFGYFIWSRRGK